LEAVELDESWLPLMFEWLSDPYTNRIARVGAITLDGQRRWYESLATRTDYWVRGIVRDGERIGALGLKNIEGPTAESFVYLGPATARRSGVGGWAVAQLEQEARARGIEHIWAVVADENEAAQRLLTGCGYERTRAWEDWGGVLERDL
jgi:RimJ/RimL family protein N-acetyltransferase